ncbi:hypothetical protein [Niallia taxi]|uniref:hypothetical protein n=1 Tax=Niallia taxi TaxID=2499688 RepID=UPI0015F7583B|nr:hypothetical protein [Niallia taxi]
MKPWMIFALAFAIFIGVGIYMFGIKDEPENETKQEEKVIKKEEKPKFKGNVYETDLFSFYYPTDWDITEDQSANAAGAVKKSNTNKAISFSAFPISNEDLQEKIKNDIAAFTQSDEFKTNTLTQELKEEKEADYTVYSYEVTTKTEFYGVLVMKHHIFFDGEIAIEFTGVIPSEPKEPEKELSEEEYKLVTDSFQIKEIEDELETEE